jgi:hypothetical protein
LRDCCGIGEELLLALTERRIGPFPKPRAKTGLQSIFSHFDLACDKPFRKSKFHVIRFWSIRDLRSFGLTSGWLARPICAYLNSSSTGSGNSTSWAKRSNGQWNGSSSVLSISAQKAVSRLEREAPSYS